jgi:hypothetical protein
MKSQKEFEEYQQNEGNLKNHPLVIGWDVLAQRMPLDSYFWEKFWMDLNYESSIADVRLFPEVYRGNFTINRLKNNEKFEDLIGFCQTDTLKKLQVSEPKAFSKWFLKRGAGCLLSQGRVDDLELFLEDFKATPTFYVSDTNFCFISNFIYHADKLSEDEKQRVIEMFPLLTDLRKGHPLLTDWIINEHNLNNCIYLASQKKVQEMEKQYVESPFASRAFETTIAFTVIEGDVKGFKKLLKISNDSSHIRNNSRLVYLALKNVLSYFNKDDTKGGAASGKSNTLKAITQIFDLIYDKSQELKVGFPMLLPENRKELTDWLIKHAPHAVLENAPIEVLSAFEAGSLKDKYINENKNGKRKVRVL